MKKLLIFVFVLFPFIIVTAQIQMPSLFNDGMVLQCGQENKLWGTTEAGQTLTLSFNGQIQSTIADSNGNFSFSLSGLSVSNNPQTLTITAGTHTKEIHDVLVGNVFLLCGQSNMAWRLNQLDADIMADALADADYPNIRYYTVAKNYEINKIWGNDNLGDTPWVKTSVQTAPAYSALGFYFGRKLYKDKQIPIGLIDCSQGSSNADAWISQTYIDSHPELKPYLARGEMQTIGATTTDEYRKFIEKDKALERRFQPIMVNPPSVEQTIQILKGLKDSYEAFHKITITDEAIESAAVLSDRYISDRSLPDKAIDLIDEASSKAKVNYTVKPQEIKKIEEKIKSLSASRDEASLQRNYEKAAKLQSEIINLENELKTKNQKFMGGEKSTTKSIGANEIAQVVAKWTGIPVTKITESEKDRLLHLEDILHKRVVGQNEAVNAVAKAIRRSRVGLQDSKRPIGSFLFMGQTGVGKTELCKAIAEAMFDDENNIVRIDMSEYMESHSVSKLIGSPPGYVGFEEGGQLTEQIRRKPYSVVLFDEIEKAHPDIFNALLQILDDGRLTDGQGRTVSFKNTIIIMTSNLGANEVKEHRRSLGFGGEEQEEIDSNKIYMDALKHKFKPEFINRIDVICVFQPLTHDDLVKISKILISNINKRLKEKNLSLKITEEALNYVVEKGSNSEYGARPLKRFIQQEIEDNIAEMILMGKLKNEGTIIIDVKDNNLSFENE